MRLQFVPARQGAQWVRQGFRVFFSRPMAFAGLFAAFMFGVLLIALLPAIGWLLVLALLPLGSLGFMIGTREALEGRLPTPAVFVAPLRADRQKRMDLIRLGLAYVVSAFIVTELSNLIDGGAFDNLVEGLNGAQGASPEAAALRTLDASAVLVVLSRLGLAALLSIPFWHSPALVHWDGHGWGKALFSSTAACWVNKGAFLVFGCTWVAVIVMVGVVANLLFAIVGHLELMSYALAPLALIISTVFYVSLYFTFADCFKATEPPAALPGASLST